MTTFTILQDIISKPSIVEEDVSVLSLAEFKRLHEHIKNLVKRDNVVETKDNILQLAYSCINNLPGLDTAEDKHFAVDKLVKRYFEK